MKITALLIIVGLGVSPLCFAQSADGQPYSPESSVQTEPSLAASERAPALAEQTRESASIPAQGDANKTRQNNLTASGLSPSRSIGKVVLALIVVVGLIFAVAAVLKRAGLSSLNRGKQLVLRESLSVGAKERLVVVDFAGESLLIGVASGNVNLVKSVPLLGVDSSNSPAAHLGARNPLDFQHKLNEFLLKGQK